MGCREVSVWRKRGQQDLWTIFHGDIPFIVPYPTAATPGHFRFEGTISYIVLLLLPYCALPFYLSESILPLGREGLGLEKHWDNAWRIDPVGFHHRDLFLCILLLQTPLARQENKN
ncbi:hypothetical protein D5086_001089 [Populus alba]|uniref:Uncharacterized protein n=1 Tax=Populus alba TaxID=43335 RepID=A0ACC4CYE6_POPAL